MRERIYSPDMPSYDRGMKIADKIRAIRSANGWTQQQFAEAMNVAQSTVNRWLGGAEPEGHRRPGGLGRRPGPAVPCGRDERRRPHA